MYAILTESKTMGALVQEARRWVVCGLMASPTKGVRKKQKSSLLLPVGLILALNGFGRQCQSDG